MPRRIAPNPQFQVFFRAMRYAVYVRNGDWNKVSEFDAKDAVDALANAARSLLPHQHDKPIMLKPADESAPQPSHSSSSPQGEDRD